MLYWNQACLRYVLEFGIWYTGAIVSISRFFYRLVNYLYILQQHVLVYTNSIMVDIDIYYVYIPFNTF